MSNWTLFGCVGLLLAAAPLPRAPSTGDDPRLPSDPAVRAGMLPNGLRYRIRHNAYPANRAELRLVVNAGSVLEDDDQRGLAHLLEHLAFNGTPHFPGHEIWRYLERVGARMGADVNATTGHDETVYMLTLPTDSAEIMRQGLQILEDWTHRMTLDSLQFERERLVVIEEWRGRQGAAGRIGDKLSTSLLAGSRYADRSPIGTLASLQQATLGAVRRYYRDWYRPDLMTIVIVGAVQVDSMEAEVRRRFGAVPARPPLRPRPDYRIGDRPGTEVAIVLDAEATGSDVTLTRRAATPAAVTETVYRRGMVIQLHDVMLTARLAEQGLDSAAPFLAAGASGGGLVRHAGLAQLAARAKAGKSAEALASMMAEVDRVRRDGFSPAELDRQKAMLLRQYEHALTQRDRIHSAQLAAGLVDESLTGEPLLALETEVALARRLLPGITLSEVAQVAASRFSDSNRVVIATGPSGSTVDEAALRSVLTRATQLDAYHDRTLDEALLPKLPEPGRVIRRSAVDSLGLQTWELSNGVRLILKPTTFNPDEVIVSAYRDGGVSVVADSDLVAATTAAELAGRSGLGQHDAVSLGKRLAGTHAGVGYWVSQYSEGVSAGGSPRDLELVLQLLHLAFTAPRMDPAAFEQYRSMQRDRLVNRAAEPEAALSDTFSLVLANHAPRARLFDEAFLRELDPERSLAFLRQRFGNADGFTFVVVGAFSPDSLEPLVARYLGGLPARARAGGWRDDGVRPPEGIVTRVLHKGSAPKATAAMTLVAEADLSREEGVRLQALVGILRHRLWERLRQELGGTYGVEVSGGIRTAPEPLALVSIHFATDPARLDALLAEVMAQLDSVRSGGPTATELQTYQEEYRRQRETDMKGNGWWMRSLVLYDQRGWSLDQLTGAEALVRQLTPQQLRLAARRYLNLSRYVRVSLLPEQSGR